MESIISDKDAMDPEVVVGGDRTVSAWPRLWQGLPQSWALAVFVVCSVAVSSWSFTECVAGLTVATVIVFLRGSCRGVCQTAAGSWLQLLHQCCHLSGVVVGVRTTLQYMAGHGSWLSTQMTLNPRMASLAVLAFIITLHSLGLERSRILRLGLLVCVPLTLSFMLIGELMLFSGDKATELLHQRPTTLNKVADCAAFFSLVYSSSLQLTIADEKRTCSLFFPIKGMFVSCFVAIGFLSLAFADVRVDAPGELLFFEVLQERGSGTWRLLRGGLAAVSMTSLSLSLVELVAGAQRGVVGVAGVFLPPRIARDHWWTGTQLTAISTTGLISAVLLFLPLKSLISLSSAGYLLSQTCDIIFTVYKAYQPSFVPKNNGTDGDRVSYQLLSDTAPLVEDNTDSESELSDDSGHSSDTDIDAAVHEYKQTVKVEKAIDEPRPMPTVHSARVTVLSLITVMTACIAMASALSFGHTYIFFFCFIGDLLVISVISRQPQESEEQGSRVLSPWQPCIVLTLQLTLAALLIPRLWIPLLVWVFIGLVSWLVQKRRQLWQLQARLSRNADRVRIPRLQLTQNFPTSYLKLSTLDTVHIVR